MRKRRSASAEKPMPFSSSFRSRKASTGVRARSAWRTRGGSGTSSLRKAQYSRSAEDSGGGWIFTWRRRSAARSGAW